MSKLKSIGTALLFSVLGAGAGVAYSLVTGEIGAAQFISEIKTFAGSVFVAVGGTGGILLIASQFLKSKANEYKTIIDTMVQENSLTAEQATFIKQSISDMETEFTNVVTKFQSKVDEFISEAKALRETDTELTERLRTFLDNLSSLAVEDVIEEVTEDE